MKQTPPRQQHRLQAAWSHLFDPQALVPFLVGSMALAVLGNAVFQLFTNWLGTGSPALLGIIFTMLLVLIVASLVLAHVLNRLPPPAELKIEHPDPRSGLILLVSNEEACLAAIRWHQATLQHSWLVHSTMTANIAQEVAKYLEEQHIKVDLCYVSDVFDPTVCAKEVEGIYGDLPAGLTARDVILDFTGMTAIASIGAVLACMGRQAPMQYTPAQRDENGRVIRSLPPFEVILVPIPAGGPSPTATAAVGSAESGVTNAH
ncbi:MAG: hypothetical protein M3Z04_00895 [Chloroflexota bacterium]|nr:hypothetical protein [Chloroflexota bacterium]